MTRQPCSICGELVLPTTLERTGGMCMICYKKDQSHKHGQLFVSYRRKDSFERTKKLVNSLCTQLPDGIKIFFDVQRLESGRDWSDQIFEQLYRSHAVLAIIGPTWASFFSKHSLQIDVMLREVEWAIDNRRALLPVLVGGASMPLPGKLPKSISQITRIQALSISDDSYSADVASLAKRIPNLITEYGDSYSAVFPDHSVELRKPAFFSGKWEVLLQDQVGNKVTIDFVIRDGTQKVDGFYTSSLDGTKRKFSGEHKLQLGTSGQVGVVVGIRLDGFINGIGPFGITIPLKDKRGDTYIGISEEGFTIWSKQLEQAW